MRDDQFGMGACLDSIAFEVERLHGNPFEMLGRYLVRADQDVFFNKTMIEAMKEYIRIKGIRWNQ